jgi:hypothetical protein
VSNAHLHPCRERRPLPIPFTALRQPRRLPRLPETDEIAARLRRETEARLQASRMLIDAAKQTLTRTPSQA